ncbi:MAG TPA: methyl-accepting chemotaxis protein, partial [Patescibacteria group bacterium]|nr:methyl-accepting chemotaxis protein [Patescibacteria group bacterium]
RVATDEERALLSRIARADGDYSNSVDRLIALRKIDTPAENIARVFEEETQPLRQVELQAMDAFIAVLQSAREAGKAEAAEDASFAISLVWVISVAMALVAGIVAFVLIRALGQQVGTAVGQIQISSDVLQEAASKQSTGAKEKVMVMHEITTTIKELLASSRQIAENAQRVASVAEQAVSAARSGDGTVQQATQSIEGIRRQVDLIVGHMLELGKKSQQIGSVLGIVSELAEQTNILAINATIEAVGAGETGRRFAVVAEEIRKLADRIAGSTKEIHGMIEDVRGAVNTTVMATEAGSKAVDAGNQKFSEVAASFKQIAGLVSTTTEAAREIELSTKQQASAVEQVNGAIANVVQATLETEEIAIQTRKTGFQLAQLSGELSRLVQPQTSA